MLPFSISRSRRVACAMLCFAFCLFAGAAHSAYQLVWSDEFDQPSIDTNKWNFETGGGGWGNNEWEYYTSRPENAYTSGGLLVIQAKQESYGGLNYTSARMTTKNKGDWAFGRIDVRAKLPYGQGLWPAIWMMPTDSVFGGWPRSGETDIMELLGQNTKTVYGTLHYADQNGNHLQSGNSLTTSTGDFSNEFHVFSLIWTSNQFNWQVDGVTYQTQYKTKPFNQRFFIILNVAVGGNWPGYPDATTVFPQTMQIDYVRIYQDPDARCYGGSPAPIPGTIYAVNYDRGGQNVAYWDSDPGINQGTTLTPATTCRVDEGPDTQPTTEYAGWNLGWSAAGEWTEYTVQVATTRYYKCEIRVASGAGGSPFQLNMDGVPITSGLSVPNTGGWDTWISRTVEPIPLTAGRHVLRLVTNGPNSNFSRIIFSESSLPVTLSGVELE